MAAAGGASPRWHPPDHDGEVSEGDRSAAEYDAMASQYARKNEEGAFNALYERPATLALLGDVRGRQVLEVGCGAGPLTELLIDAGANVTAVDVSSGMIELARARLNGRASLLVADISEPLAFADDASFDIVVGSLVLHYIERWEPVLEEFRRVLRPGGAVVFSTHHPTMDWELTADSYFALRQVIDQWTMGDETFEVTFWRRPLTEMTSAIAASGFLIERLVEPRPSPDLLELDPIAYRKLTTAPRFIFFRLIARPSTEVRV